MTAFGFGVIGLGLLILIGGFIAALVVEEHPQTAERYGTRFMRDAALFGVRIAGASIILFGSVFVIVAHHTGR